MKIKEKIEDWFDIIVYRITDIRGLIQEFFLGLKRWFSYYKVLMNVYDFDHSSILSVEKHQIARVRDDITRFQSYTNWERDVRYINLALKLIDIIEEDGCSILHGGGLHFEPCGDGTSKVVHDPESKWTMPIYVNTSNSERFCKIPKDKFKDSTIGPLMKDHLRIEKAWHLYHKLRVYHMRSWWD